MTRHLADAFVALVACAAVAAPQKIIFDTDMVTDFDDTGAVAVLHALADAGECEIIAMGTCTRDNSSVAAVEVFNAYYGRPDIPVGCSKEIGVAGVPGNREMKAHQKYVDLAAAYPEWVKHANSSDAPDACEVYRKALAAAPDKGVIVCSVGFMTNMRRLLESKPDAHSKLDGRALVAKKVHTWYAMACRHPAGKEYNVQWDAESAKIAFETWPTPIVFSDYNYGENTFTGRLVAEREYAYRNPVKDIFAKCLPPREKCRGAKTWNTEEGHSSWDEVTVFAAVRCGTKVAAGRFIRQFGVEKGTYRIDADGTSTWVADEKSRNCRLTEAVGRDRFNYPKWTMAHMIDELMAREPKCRRMDDAAVALRKSCLERTKTGVRMLWDGKTLWNFEISNPEGRPFFHPLNLPSGKPLTDLRPKDHIWHLGYWFSWKYINGVNYWEPADAKRKGVEPEGCTRVTRRSIPSDSPDCIVKIDLEYGPRGAAPVLAENRTVIIDQPDPKGGYTITTRHTFTALADVTLDRTPPHGSTASGKWGGGYAGATLRLDPAQAAAFEVRGFAGGRSSAEVTGRETKYVDFTDPATGEGVTFTQLAAPPSGKFYVWPDRRMVNPSPVYDGPVTLKAGEKLELAYKLAVHADRTVRGTLERRPVEKLDRGLAASVTPEGTYVSWRLLGSDAPDRAFDLWRKADGRVEKVNPAPIVQTTDFCMPGFTNAAAQYSVDGETFVPVAFTSSRTGEAPCRTIRLACSNDAPTLVGVGDLDGDGRYDFVIKTPRGGTDPWDLVYTPATNTCRLEAYSSDGRFLWRRDHGWNIEMGAWYSPYFVADMDGDGKAEVVTKLAPLEPDYRDPDGRVQRGPEYLAVLDGMTGEVRAKAPWPERSTPDPVDEYNHYASRNQIGLAYLDGKTPCAVVERGTYRQMLVDAWCLRNGRLERLWRFNNEFMPYRFKGQGDHAMLCADVDGDGCDEVLIGSLTLDHDGTVLWCNGRGHSDAHYLGDIDPMRPGMELFFVYETAQRNGGGLLLTDPVTGEDIWKLPVPTRHVHSAGMCADIDPVYPGLELYGQEVGIGASNDRKMTHPASDNRWLYTASGSLISAYTNCTYNFGQGRPAIWWDGDLQREIYAGGMLRDHAGPTVARGVAGCVIALDLCGDWREEIICGAKGELRICTTDIPALDRRVTLMRDPYYRSRIAMETSGYAQRPILGYVPSAVAPNISLRLDRNGRSVRIDVTAPLDRPLAGTLSLDRMPPKWTVDFTDTKLDLKPGERWTKTMPIRRPPNPKGRYDFTLRLTRPAAPPLVLHQPQMF